MSCKGQVEQCQEVGRTGGAGLLVVGPGSLLGEGESVEARREALQPLIERFARVDRGRVDYSLRVNGQRFPLDALYEWPMLRQAGESKEAFLDAFQKAIAERKYRSSVDFRGVSLSLEVNNWKKRLREQPPEAYDLACLEEMQARSRQEDVTAYAEFLLTKGVLEARGYFARNTRFWGWRADDPSPENPFWDRYVQAMQAEPCVEMRVRLALAALEIINSNPQIRERLDEPTRNALLAQFSEGLEGWRAGGFKLVSPMEMERAMNDLSNPS